MKLRALQLAVFAALILLWHVTTKPGLLPNFYFEQDNRAAFFFGEPAKVFWVIIDWFTSFEIFEHLWVTLLETLLGLPLLVSGRLTLDEKKRQFFTNMPAIVHRGETGEIALVSHITQTSKFYGVKTSEHSGLWILPMRPGGLTEAQTGFVFWGLKKMPATRFRYINAMTGATEQAVVAIPAAAAATVLPPV